MGPQHCLKHRYILTLNLICIFFFRRKGGNPDEPVCIALSSDEEDEATEDQAETTLTEDGSEVKLESSGEYKTVP
jgi:hypothetical protein